MGEVHISVVVSAHNEEEYDKLLDEMFYSYNDIHR